MTENQIQNSKPINQSSGDNQGHLGTVIQDKMNYCIINNKNEQNNAASLEVEFELV